MLSRYYYRFDGRLFRRRYREPWSMAIPHRMMREERLNHIADIIGCLMIGAFLTTFCFMWAAGVI